MATWRHTRLRDQFNPLSFVCQVLYEQLFEYCVLALVYQDTAVLISSFTIVEVYATAELIDVLDDFGSLVYPDPKKSCPVRYSDFFAHWSNLIMTIVNATTICILITMLSIFFLSVCDFY